MKNWLKRIVALYIAVGMVTLVLQVLIRAETCAGIEGCAVSYVKGGIWSAGWPIYWGMELTGTMPSQRLSPVATAVPSISVASAPEVAAKNLGDVTRYPNVVVPLDVALLAPTVSAFGPSGQYLGSSTYQNGALKLFGPTGQQTLFSSSVDDKEVNLVSAASGHNQYAGTVHRRPDGSAQFYGVAGAFLGSVVIAADGTRSYSDARGNVLAIATKTGPNEYRFLSTGQNAYLGNVLLK